MDGGALEWRLPLMCNPPNPRPRQLTDAMLREAGAMVIRQFVKDGSLPAKELDEAICDLLSVTRHDRHMDGYEIAKILERYHHWTCNRDMLEIFDEFSINCGTLLEKAEIEWAAENPMGPPFPIGTTVKTPHGNGQIEKVSKWHVARYIVGIEGRHLVVMFEDVSAVDA
jgi:hypothetical protein